MKYTPATITEQKAFYTIPLYQRLFEWNEENIEGLLEDLNKEFKTTEKGDYYIGMLTSTKEKELVDGQQRFTVIMLLGCVLQKYYKGWESFLMNDNRIRIDYAGRPSDNSYLRHLIERKDSDGAPFKNIKMAEGYGVIKRFLEDEERVSKDDRTKFAEYIYNHLAFFISDLPEGYSPMDLNKYFERMNTTGKNLEQHEILKVKLLNKLDCDIDKYMLLWNLIADVDTPLIRERKNEKIEERKMRAIKADIATIFSENLINGVNAVDQENALSIGEVAPSDSEPKKDRETHTDSRCVIPFPQLLLQVLYRQNEKMVKNKADFFKSNNLLETFQEYLPYSGDQADCGRIKEFMEMLTKARLALDICFVRTTDYGYSLDMNLNEDNASLKRLMMLQSMYFVSSSLYTNWRWFNWLMNQVRNGIPDVDSMFESLKVMVNKEELPKYEDLAYPAEIRFWFWKLDYYIWENRAVIFKDHEKELKIAENYVFKRNRSIEHIAPQTPQKLSEMKWDENNEEDKTLCNSFGNLAMISQGLNSSLRNEPYEMKKANVEAYCNGSKAGTIESLKMLVAHMMYPGKWTKETIKEHGKEMYRWLGGDVSEMA